MRELADKLYLTRREFLKGLVTVGAVAGTAGLSGCLEYFKPKTPKPTPTPEVKVYREKRVDIHWDENTGKYYKVEIDTDFFIDLKTGEHYYYNIDPETKVMYKVRKHTPELKLDALEEEDRKVIQEALDYMKKNAHEDYEYVMYWLEGVTYSPTQNLASADATMWIPKGWASRRFGESERVGIAIIHETDHEELHSISDSKGFNETYRENRAKAHTEKFLSYVGFDPITLKRIK